MLKRLVLAAVAVGILGSSAMAADLMQPPPPEEMMTGGWDGGYVGGGVIFESSTTIAETIVGGQGILGFNHTFDSFLIGGEVYVMPYWSSLSGLGASLGGEVRGGFLATESVLLYGALGAEITNSANTYGTIGGGVEFKATDNLSLDLEYKYYVGLNNAWRGNHIGISANWHF